MELSSYLEWSYEYSAAKQCILLNASPSLYSVCTDHDLKISANSKTPLPFADFSLEAFLREELLPWRGKE